MSNVLELYVENFKNRKLQVLTRNCINVSEKSENFEWKYFDENKPIVNGFFVYKYFRSLYQFVAIKSQILQKKKNKQKTLALAT